MQSQVNRDDRHSLIENILFHSPDGVRAVELAERCGVDRRTIYRDLSRLRKNGIPIYQKQGRFFVSREYYHAPVQLTLNETVALFTAVRVLSQVANQHNPHVISALTKLSEGLPRSMANHVGTVGALLRHHSVDRLFVRVTETIIHAWGEQRWVRMWIAGEQAAREIAPHFLEATADGALYVVGVEARTEAVRAFRLEHILRVEALKRTFNPRPSVIPQNYLADRFGIISDHNPTHDTVVLVVSAEVAQQLKAEPPASIFKTASRDDGRLEVHLRVREWQELAGWVRRAGSHVEVIEPQAMRQVMVSEARRMAAMYNLNSSENRS